jgi:cytochrome P450
VIIRQAGRELTSPLGAVPLTVPLPFNRTFLAARAGYDQTVARLVEQRRQAATAGDDLLSALVQARDPETGATLDDREVRDQATTIYFLWKPVAITLAWVWYLLAGNASAAERVHDEAARSPGALGPAVDELASLPYTRAVAAEELRLHPPVLLLPREAAEDDELAGHVVPAGTRVAMSAHVTHRHPAFWEEPERFEPERFLRPDDRPPFAYFPFAEPGPRRCPGRDIAQAELVLAIAAIARRYRIELLPGERVATKMTVARDFSRGLRMRLAPV